MKKFIPVFITIAALIIIGVIYYNFGCVRGSGNVIGKSYDVEEFKNVELNLGSSILYLSQSESQSLRLEAEDNILERLKVNVEGETLKISRSIGCFWYSEPVKVYANVINIESLTINGSAEIIGQTDLGSEELKLEINGSGKMDLEVQSETIESSITGSGKIILEGKTDEHKIEISGSGQIEALDLVTKKSKIEISGSGQAKVAAIEDLDIDVSGLGKVEYIGNPTNISQDISGSASVEKIEGEIVVAEMGVSAKELKSLIFSEDSSLNIAEADLAIQDINGIYVKASLVFEDFERDVLAVYTDDGWKVFLKGKTAFLCSLIEEYDFPIVYVDECYDEDSGEVIEREEERDARDVSDDDLLEQIQETQEDQEGPQVIEFEGGSVEIEETE